MNFFFIPLINFIRLAHNSGNFSKIKECKFNNDNVKVVSQENYKLAQKNKKIKNPEK